MKEFYWMPAETVCWIRNVVSALDLWIVVSPTGANARLLDVEELQSGMFEGTTEDMVQIFFGSADLAEGPQWREVRGRRLLDFPRSYAVQFVPAIFDPDRKTLLQGRIAILRPSQYDDPSRARKLSLLYRRLLASMRQKSEPERIVVQYLPSGGRKVWKDVLVGRNIPQGDTIKLKAFAKGEVVFAVEPAAKEFH